jgi:aminopeptidase-like protein
MKNILAIITLCIVNLFSAQFSVSIKTTNDFIANEAYLYKLNGSKDIIIDKTIKKNNLGFLMLKKNMKGF